MVLHKQARHVCGKPQTSQSSLRVGNLARLLAEAVAAVNGAVSARFEGQVRLLAAGGALGHEDLARTFAEAGAGRASHAGPRGTAEAGTGRTRSAATVVVPHPRDLPADHAAFRLIPEPEFGVVLLLLGGEDEVLVAVLALQRLVGERHDGSTRGNVRPSSRYSLPREIRIGMRLGRNQYPLPTYQRARRGPNRIWSAKNLGIFRDVYRGESGMSAGPT